MDIFIDIMRDLNIPLNPGKWIGPVQILTYLGLEIDAEFQTIKVPMDKVKKCVEALEFVINSKKIRLKRFQSIVGLLNFITQAIPAGRAFNRRFYDAMSSAKMPYHFVRISQSVKSDAMVWLTFLRKFNGIRIFNEHEWLQSDTMELFSDASGNKNLGCGCYFAGEWAVFPWPSEWNEHVFKDITFLELVPIMLSFYLWGNDFKNKKIILRSDNQALVEIVNKKT